MLIEAAAGLLDHADPEVRIRAEAEEETGYRVFNVRKVMEAYMSPGSVTEKLYFFLGEYDDSSRIGTGGGIEDEGEDVETLEMTLPQALAAIAEGTIMDAKTIMLVQHVALHRALPFEGLPD
jgi:nudix-type nucleoside diphosphatase (YffH/AdpP family)